MKGLIIKDLIQLKQVWIILLVIMVSYTYLGIMNNSGTLLFFVMVGIIAMMTPLTCAGYDEQCNWDSFGNSFPVSRTKVVLARYIAENIVILVTFLLIAVAQIAIFFTGGEILGLPGYVGMIIMALIINTIMNPIIYKFGAQKSRFVMIAICLVLTIISSIVLMFATTSERDWVISINDKIDAFIDTLSQIPGSVIMLILLAIFGVLYALSIRLSISIYKKKDL